MKGLTDLQAIVNAVPGQIVNIEGSIHPNDIVQFIEPGKPKKEKELKLDTKADKFDQLLAVSKTLNKQFETTNSIVRLGDRVNQPIPSIATNLPSLDKYVLGCGGVPRGRIIEVYGPASAGKTTLCLHIIAQEQKNTDNLCAIVDAEHALDITYAAKLGVNVDELLISQPDSGEQALQTVEALIESKAVSLILVDSVAALVPAAELSGEFGDSNIGLQARLMSQACRKLRGIAAINGVTVIFLNQLRDKIGVMYGCFNYNSRIVLADGSTKKIGYIVNNRLPLKVLSLNKDSGEISPKRITSWHENGNADKFLQIVTNTAHNLKGTNNLSVTENHIILTPFGDVPANTLKVGDIVSGLGYNNFNNLQLEIAIGSILGDGSIRITGAHNTILRIGHGAKQKEYCQWKEKIYENLSVDSGENSNGSYSFSTAASYDLTPIRKLTYREDNTRTISKEFLSKLTSKGVAIWYMDDGTFGGSYEKWGKGNCSISVKSYSLEDKLLLADRLEELGFPRPSIGSSLSWYSTNSFLFQERVAKYIHPSMEYKIHPELRGRFSKEDFLYEPSARIPIPVELTVLKVYTKPRTRSMKKFDLEIEDNHTYFVDGVAVHNSPEVTTGGNALKFYASIRLDIRRKDVIGDKEQPDGHKIRIKAVKNKMAAPLRETTINLLYDTGIDTFSDFVTYALKLGVLEQSGPWVKFAGKPVASGLTNACESVRLDSELFKAIKAAVESKENE